MGDCPQCWLVPVFVTLHSAKYWMKAPKLVKTKKSQLKVPVRTADRKMQLFSNSNRLAQNLTENFIFHVTLQVVFSKRNVPWWCLEYFNLNLEKNSKSHELRKFPDTSYEYIVLFKMFIYHHTAYILMFNVFRTHCVANNIFSDNRCPLWLSS